jgi:HAD superfamily hydrolase (TIGR01450 family)
MTESEAPYRTVIFDLDGTLFRGRTALPGAADALNRLREHVPCRFLSNNGERRGASLVERLRSMGFIVEEDEIVSSADLVLGFLADQRKTYRVLALTSNDLSMALQEQGHRLVQDDTAEVVIVGVDRALTRERMVQGLRAALNGALLIGTNEDPTYPAEDGLRPAAGAYVGFFRGMGFEPAYLCGKPDAWAIQRALSRWEIEDPSRCLVVGDNLRTDIAGALRIGADSVLVLTGVSAVEDANLAPEAPTAVLDSVSELSAVRLQELATRFAPRPRASRPAAFRSDKGGQRG